jgi:hypothetical protein
MPRKAAELPGVFSSASVLSLPLGTAFEDDGLGGYAVDMRAKAQEPSWPPSWLSPTPRRLWVASVQLGLTTAVDCADDLASHQREDGAWPHGYEYPHTFALPPGWVSSIAQGQAASFFARVHAATGEDRYGDVARAALRPMTVPAAEGGCLAHLGGGPFPEEYPTSPGSFVLNGGLFATWGFRDVAVALGDDAARGDWEAMVATLRDNLRRWDTGWWSRYDLFPHRVPNLASSFYHALHITQLRAMARLSGEAAFGATADRWEGYAASRARRTGAFAAKAAFRLAVPRNRALARRLPWAKRASAASSRGT